MKRAFIFWFCTVAFIFSLRAQTNIPAAPPKRVLFIVETSSETKSSAAAAHELTSALIESGMAELIGQGDTLGVWTFNEKVYPGLLPMQIWRTNSATEISERVTAFLKLQRYEKKPNLQTIWPPLAAVVRNSPVLTIVIITSGKSPFIGTPYDNEINLYFKEHQREFQKKKIPFVTMFLTRRGQILQYSISPAVGDVKIPKPPPEPAPVVVTNVVVVEKPIEKPAAKALVITKSGAVKTSVEQAEEIAARIDAPTVPKVEPPKIEIPKNEIPNLAPGTAIITGSTDEKYLVSPTNAVLLEKNEATNAAPQTGASTNSSTVKPPENRQP